MSSRIGFGKVADAQPIQTVVSQPPIKVVPQTLVTTKPRLPATSAKVFVLYLKLLAVIG